MSNRNNQANKSAARERLRAERDRQAKKDKVRRQAVVGVSVVAVLAVGAGVAFGVSKMLEPSAWEAAAEKSLVEPANTSGENGTIISIGGKDAENTVDVYEDLRCPACASFEQSIGETVKKGATDNKYKLQIHFGSIIDDMVTGEGSKNAISALGAALNVSTAAFTEYHGLLYSAEHHPAESEDKFADDDYLLKVSDNIEALKDDKGFEKALKNGTYDKWALSMIDSFNDAGIQGTPTVRIDGKDVETAKLPEELAKLGVA